MTIISTNGAYTYGYAQSGGTLAFTTSVAGSTKTYTPLVYRPTYGTAHVYSLGNVGNHSIIDVEDGGLRLVYGLQGTGAAAPLFTFDARGAASSLVNTLGVINGEDLIFTNRANVYVGLNGSSVSYDLTMYGSDGTAAGTRLLFNVNAQAASIVDTQNGRALISTNNGTHFVLFGTDGTKAGTEQILGFEGLSVKMLDHFNGKDILRTFSGGNVSLYVTDGTAHGTQLIYSQGIAPSLNGDLTVTTSAVFVDRAAGEDIFAINSNGHVKFVATNTAWTSTHTVFQLDAPTFAEVKIAKVADLGNGHEAVQVTTAAHSTFYDLDVVHGGAVVLIGHAGSY